ncbi:MAG: ABC transporter substrate-binding protein, partial [Candidatus Bathyarchaeia archaeon]
TVVYGSDPKNGEWQIYTEGWGRSAFIKYQDALPSQMYAPWLGYMPGFREPTYWNYENSRLDEITKRIITGNFTSKEERDLLIKEAVILGINESVRVFIASIVEPYVVNKAVEGAVNDFGAGITVRWTLINARITGTDGLLKVGMKQIYQGAWNPIGGFKDFYSRKAWDCIYDPVTFAHPHTGEIIPIRALWKVETLGPEGKLNVPEDSIVWDPYEEKWRNVGEGVAATSKVTFDLKYSNWHHGIPMKMADLIYAIYFLFEWGTNEGINDPTFDPEYTSGAEPMVKTLKGIKFLSESRVEVYVDYWHFDKDFIADYASVWASMPWEIIAAMEKVVLDKKFAFSNSASKALDLEWLSLIIKSDAEEIKNALVELRDNKTVPKPLKDFVTSEEAIKRYDSSIEWISRYGHSVISNGPFRLVEYNPEARTITMEAFNDPSYPFERNHWSSFESIRAAEIKKINIPSRIVIGKTSMIELFIEVGGEPSDEAIVNYRIVDPEGKTIVKGRAKPSTPIGTFEILLDESITSNLKIGSYRLKILAVSTKAMKPYIFETSLLVTSE